MQLFISESARSYQSTLDRFGDSVQDVMAGIGAPSKVSRNKSPSQQALHLKTFRCSTSLRTRWRSTPQTRTEDLLLFAPTISTTTSPSAWWDIISILDFDLKHFDVAGHPFRCKEQQSQEIHSAYQLSGPLQLQHVRAFYQKYWIFQFDLQRYRSLPCMFAEIWQATGVLCVM